MDKGGRKFFLSCFAILSSWAKHPNGCYTPAALHTLVEDKNKR